MLVAIRALRGAAGLDLDVKSNDKESLANLLMDFSIGTEQAKLAPPASKESEIGLF